MVSSVSRISELKANWKSGLTVSLVSLPLSISLAVASGATPVAGIITALWAGLIGAAFGGSNYNIIGPTGALSGIIASYTLLHGSESLPALALVTGLFVFLAYVCRLERYLIFIPSSVIHGFTLGVACIIGLSQLNFALGLQHLPKHEKFIENVIESLRHVPETSWPVVGVFVVFFLGLMVLKKVVPSIPGPIILSPLGIALGYAVELGYFPLRIETLGSKFGAIKPVLIMFPSFSFGTYLVVPGLVIAFVALIETMLSAKIADVMTKTKHDARQEMLGLGYANIASALCGGIPATAALARTALNIKTGATSRLSGIVSSIFIACNSFLFLSFFAYMPMAVIAAILLSVAIAMVEREHFIRLFRLDKANFCVALLVAAITVYEDPIIGIIVGIALALLLLVNKLAQSHYEIKVHESTEELSDAEKRNLLIYSFKGKLVYLNSQAHIVRFQTDFTQYSGIILKLKDVYFIDLDGVDALEEIIDLIRNRGQLVVLICPGVHVRNMLLSSTKIQELDQEGLIFNSLQEALQSLIIDNLA